MCRPSKRHPVMVYVDEFQDYLHLPTDLTDVLAQARGLGVGLTLAHQHLAQLPPAMRSAVLANARSRVAFQLGSDDARAIAHTMPGLAVPTTSSASHASRPTHRWSPAARSLLGHQSAPHPQVRQRPTQTNFVVDLLSTTAVIARRSKLIWLVLFAVQRLLMAQTMTSHQSLAEGGRHERTLRSPLCSRDERSREPPGRRPRSCASLAPTPYRIQAARSPSEQTSPASAQAVGRIAVGRLSSLLSERDMDVVQFVSDFRYVTGTQLVRMFFVEHASAAAAARAASAVLARLTAGRLLRRAERRIGGLRGGSASYVYGIGSLGHRLLHQDGSRGRWDEPSPTFLDHTLAITELVVRLTESARLSGHAGQAAHVLTPEPRCWRTYQVGLGGMVTLKPDLHAVITTGEFEDHWFIEIDRGTESSTALVVKLKTYLDYYRSGREQERHGLFPRVLWVVPNAKRARQLDHLIGKLTLPFGADGLFMAVTSDKAVEVLSGGVPS